MMPRLMFLALILACFCCVPCESSCAVGYSGFPNCSPCSWNRWGWDCRNRCHCTVPCNRVDGRCGALGGRCYTNYAGPSCQQCITGRWGWSCDNVCYCAGGCEQSNGNCVNPGVCVAGHTGTRCTECEDYHYKPRFSDSCVPCGTNAWGTGCHRWCHCMGPCDVTDGRCTTQCHIGYAGYNCQQCAPGYGGSSCSACNSGYYGTGCGSLCHCSVPCDHVTGECPGSCDAGYEGSPCQVCPDGRWGVDCANDCHCSTRCSKESGYCYGSCDSGYYGRPCTACSAGHYGDNCASQCHCSVPCDHVTGNCPGDCDAGYSGDPCTPCASDRYGVNCAHHCHCAGTCDTVTGNCTGGCHAGYTGSLCMACTPETWGDNCSKNCHCSTTCDHVTGQCSGSCTGHYVGDTCQECDTGYWGHDCNNVCRCDGGCRQADGYCYDRPCHTGFTGSDCQQCAIGYTGSSCAQCAPGTWGENCSGDCHCSSTCDHITGQCTGSCIGHYAGDTCQECDTGFWGVECNSTCSCDDGCRRSDGNCQGTCDKGSSGDPCQPCTDGNWGLDCANECNCLSVCDKVSGICRGGCQLGFTGATCQQCGPGYSGEQCLQCPPGAWGVNCTQQCACADHLCNGIDGACTGCTVGYLGDICQTPMPILQSESITVAWDDETLQVNLHKIEETSVYSVTYKAEYRFQGLIDDWRVAVLYSSSGSTLTVPSTLFKANSMYECRIIPVFYDKAREQYVEGQPSNIIHYSTGCQTPLPMSQYYPRACEHWCECGEIQYCLLPSDCCNSMCAAPCMEFPNANNTNISLEPDSNSISIRISHNRDSGTSYDVHVLYRGFEMSKVQLIEDRGSGTIGHLEPDTLYLVLIFPFIRHENEYFVGPPISEEVLTRKPGESEDQAQSINTTHVAVGVSGAVVCVVCVVLTAVFAKKRCSKHGNSSTTGTQTAAT